MTQQFDPGHFLQFKTYRGFQTRGLPWNDTYKARVDYELGVIKQTGFQNYFLIVADFCNWMEENGIMFIARGSGCGSCVVWGLGISHQWLDPIKYDIPFERFLNPERISNPDLDIDIDDGRRWEVFEYVRQKYGQERVAKIITFGTLGGRAAIKDVARAQNIPDYQKVASTIASAIPQKKGTLIADTVAGSEFLQEQQRYYPNLFADALRVEGRPRNTSVHAAGVLIAPDDLDKYMPKYMKHDGDEESVVCSQWDMYDSEKRGMLKMDFLGLNTLRVIDQTVRTINIVRQQQGITQPFIIKDIPRNDPKTWKMLSEGKTTGVFQVERGFCQNYARRMNLAGEQDFFKLAVFVAIIRPGMMDTGQTEAYLRRASGVEVPDPMHPLLAKTFSKTFGLMCFQEDVMNAAKDFAGFSVPEADTLRKGVGKKQKAFIDKMKPQWVEGATQPRFDITWIDKEGKSHHLITKPRNPYVKKLFGNQEVREGTFQVSDGTSVTVKMEMPGATAQEADEIWAKVEAHARYSFNNAHALAYGMVSYWTAFLKANEPIHFMTHMINAEAGVGNKEDGYNYKVSQYVEEAKSLGVKVAPPCVRLSRGLCSMDVNTNTIRFGLSLIKAVSGNAVAYITTEMPKCDSFKEFILAGQTYQEVDRPATEKKPSRREWTTISKISKRDYEHMIAAGACDIFGLDRAVMLEALPKLQDIADSYHTQVVKERNGVKTKLKSAVVLEEYNAFRIDDVEPSQPVSLEQRLNREREVTGCFLSQSPFEPFRHIINQFQTTTPAEIMDGDAAYGNLVFVGMLSEFREHVITKGRSIGKPMAFMTFIGTAGTLEVICFPDLYASLQVQMGGRFKKGSVYCVQVKPDRGGEAYILSDVRLLSGKNVSLG